MIWSLPLLLGLQDNKLGIQDNKLGKPRFHLESFWPKLDGFHETIASAWSYVPPGLCPLTPFVSLDIKFKAVTNKLQSWSENGVTRLQLSLLWQEKFSIN